MHGNKMQLLSEIEEVFFIAGRGYIVVPGISFSFSPPVRIGAALEIHNPSGGIIRTQLRGVEMLNRGKPREHAPCLIGPGIAKHEIEIGAKLYLIEN